MRRSRSHLNNLSHSQQGGHGYAQQPHMPIGATRHTDEIQRRINALGGQQQYAPQQHAPQQHAMPEIYSPPQPMPGPYDQAYSAGYENMDHLRASLDQMANKLNALSQQGNASQQSQQTAQALVRQNEQITAELLELRKLVSATGAGSNDDLRAEMDAIRQALDANFRSIVQQITDAESGTSVDRFANVVETSHDKIARELEAMQASLNTVTGNSDIFSKTIEARHDEVANRIAHLQDSINAALGNPSFYAETVENSHRELVAHFEELKEGVASVAAASGNLPAPDLTSVEMRLEEITRAVVALSAGNQGLDNLDRIEARIGDLAKTVSSLQPGDDGALGRIESEIAQLRHQVNQKPEPQAAAAAVVDTSAFEMQMQEVRNTLGELNRNISKASSMPEIGFAGLADQINKLSEKIDNRSAMPMAGDAGSEAGQDQGALLARLDQLVEEVSNLKAEPVDLAPISSMIESGFAKDAGDKLDAVASKLDAVYNMGFQSTEVPDHSDTLAALGHQLTEIVTHLEQISPAQQEPISFEPIAERLSAIEEQLSASRDIAIEVASQAAEEAVERTIRDIPSGTGEGGDAGTSGAAIAALTDDLRRWQDAYNASSNDTFENFDAVKDALAMIAERLTHLEDGIQQPAPAPVLQSQPAAEGPSGTYEQAEEHLAQAAESFRNEVQQFEAQRAEPAAEPADAYEPEPAAAPEVMAQPVIEVNEIAASQSEMAAPVMQEDVSTDDAGMNPLFAAAVSEAARKPVEETPAQTSMQENLEFGSEHMHGELPEVETPGMDVRELPETGEETEDLADDVLLEPGSGAPDLAALVRQANERRKSNAKDGGGTSNSDFLASARRAAQAAAMEANLVQEEARQHESIEKADKSFSLKDILSKRKKLLMAGGAILLVAALAVPVAGFFLGGPGNTVVEAEAPQAIEPSTDPVSPAALGSDDLSGNGEEGGTLAPGAGNADASESETIQSFQTPLNDTSANVVENSKPVISEVPLDNNVAPQTSQAIDVTNVSFGNDQLKQAASASDSMALFEIGRRYANGDGTDKNMEEAALWYERSAELGFAPAQYIIGNFNEKGIGVEPNIAKAVSWYELAAERGNVVAMHNLGVLYATPNAVSAEPDMQKAFRWFGQAAEHGVRDSQVNMGIFYTKGIGTDVNLVEAYKWFAIAASSGDEDANTKLRVIEDALRPEQLQAAKAIVENWQPSTVIAEANDVKIPDAWKPATKAAQSAPVSKNTIAQMQVVLAELGYNPGPADGIMGQKTKDAIAAYRKSAGLKVSEAIDAELLRSLSKAVSG